MTLHAVQDYMLTKLERVAKRLYTEQRMNGDEMRDAAHEIMAVVDFAKQMLVPPERSS